MTLTEPTLLHLTMFIVLQYYTTSMTLDMIQYLGFLPRQEVKRKQFCAELAKDQTSDL